MYKVTIFLLAFLSSINLFGECRVSIHITHTTPSNIKLSITHDANCTVTIEESNITATPEHNQSTKNTLHIIALAKSKLGSPYKEGATGPDAYDCSGFVYSLFGSIKITIPRSSIKQAEFGEKLSRDQIKMGDILFFDTSSAGHVNHSGVYLGDGEFIHASSGNAKSVTISKLDIGFYKERFKWGVRVKGV